MTTTPEDPLPADDPHAALERALIEEFLNHLGYTLHSITGLSPEQQRDVLRFAGAYATLRLSEIEARAQYLHRMGGHQTI